MKTTLFLLTASTLSTLTTALTLKTRAATFTSFPSPLTCPTATGTSAWSLSELESLAQEVITSGKEPIETSASNAASGRCTSIKLPYYCADLLKDSGSLYFVYDAATDGYEFCGASTADLNGDGYADGCA